MKLYKVHLQKDDIRSICYVEANSEEEAMEQAKILSEGWDVAEPQDGETPAVELLGEVQ